MLLLQCLFILQKKKDTLYKAFGKFNNDATETFNIAWVTIVNEC